jgi:pyruvate formate lyase activating enzyme
MSFQVFEQTADAGVLRCLLCPHFCYLEEGDFGKCRVRQNNGDGIVHIKPGAVSCLAVEPIEKKPFRHFLPNTRTLTVGGFGCNLNCEWCENNTISQVPIDSEARVLTPQKITEIAIENSCQSVNMSYNEPIISYEYLMDLADRCHEYDLKFALKTNGFINKEPWREICSKTDAINIDWKGWTRAFLSITGATAFVARDIVREAYDSGTHIEVSIPLYYSSDEIEDQIRKVGKFLSSIDKSIPCHLLRISPSYHYEHFISNSDDIERAREMMATYMNNIYIVI